MPAPPGGWSGCTVAGAIETMRQHPSDARVQENGCAALANLAANNAENKKAIAAAGGIEAVVDAMKQHPSAAKVQENGCAALSNLAYDAKNQTAIAAAGGIEAVVAAMKQHPTAADVQEWGCAALANLAANNAENKKAIAAAGGIEAVVDAMKQHPTAAKVQANGCAALANLADNNAENKKAIAAAGGIEAVVAAMKQHPTAAKVQANGCAALSNLAYDAKNQTAIAAAGGIEAIVAAIALAGGIEAVVAAMKQHPTAAKMQANGCGALRNLAANNAENKKAIAAAGGIEAVVAAMKQHPTAAKVQANGCAALANLADNNAENKKAIAAAGGIEAVVAAMKRHPSAIYVQWGGCSALKFLGRVDENKKAIAAAGGIEAVVDAMKQHPSAAKVQENGCAALSNLAYDAKNQTAIAAAGGIEAIVAAMNQHPSAADVQEWGCGALRNLAANAKNQTAIAAAGGVEAAVAAMKEHENVAAVQQYGVGALESLADCIKTCKVPNQKAILNQKTIIETLGKHAKTVAKYQAAVDLDKASGAAAPVLRTIDELTESLDEAKMAHEASGGPYTDKKNTRCELVGGDESSGITVILAGQSRLVDQSIVTAWTQLQPPEIERAPNHDSPTVQHVELLINELLPKVAKVVIVNEAVDAVLQIGPLNNNGTHAVMDPDLQKAICEEYVECMKRNVEKIADVNMAAGASKVLLVTTSRHFGEVGRVTTSHYNHYNAPHPWTWHMHGGGFKVLKAVWELAEIDGPPPIVSAFPAKSSASSAVNNAPVAVPAPPAPAHPGPGGGKKKDKELMVGDFARLTLSSDKERSGMLVQVVPSKKPNNTKVRLARAEKPADFVEPRKSPAKAQTELEGNSGAGHYLKLKIKRVPTDDLPDGYAHGM